ncbi:hypothetical protein [Roseivirga sp.]|uniref:hypothetical protein n=1 Tax=Roseivirga sp. TaxID=1964215 RepID=UPI003B8D06C9
MIRYSSLLLLLLGIIPLSTNETIVLTEFAETTIAYESFEGTGDELGYTSNDWSGGFSDYSSVVNDANAGTGPSVTYHISSGYPDNIHDDGTGDKHFYAVDDLDDDDNPRLDHLSIITFNNVDVSGATGLKAKFLLGVDRENRFETDDYLQIYYAFDGDITSHPGVSTAFTQGSYTLLASFRGSGSGTNVSLDADNNGSGDGTIVLPFGTLSANNITLSDLSFDIAGTGANVSIRIVMKSNGGDETFIVDNMRVAGTVAASSSPPTVTTTAASSILATSALMGGEITADGGASITARGVVWSTTDTDPRIGDAGVNADAEGGTATGSFSETINSLPANTTVYFNAYATNSEGTSYGSTASFTTSQADFALTVMLEGPFVSGSMSTFLRSNNEIPTAQPYTNPAAESSSGIPATAVDWIEVEVRTGTAASSRVGSRAAFVLSDGSVVDKDGSTFTISAANGSDYYLVIHHRNHLSIMSAGAVSISSGTYTYNFTSSQSQAFGSSPMIEVDTGVFAMPSGDADDDGDVDTNDLAIWRVQNGATYVYSSNGKSDLNLDGEINATDRNDHQQQNSGKSTQVPNS